MSIKLPSDTLNWFEPSIDADINAKVIEIRETLKNSLKEEIVNKFNRLSKENEELQKFALFKAKYERGMSKILRLLK